MSFITNDFGLYPAPQVCLLVDYNDSSERMGCGIILVGFREPLSIEGAEMLADKLDFFITSGEKLNMHGIESTVTRDTPLISFSGYYQGNGYGTSLRLAKPQMQLSLSLAAKLLRDIRNTVEICLATLKGVSKQKSLRINGKLIERVIDTESERVQKQQKSDFTRQVHRYQRLECLGR